MKHSDKRTDHARSAKSMYSVSITEAGFLDDELTRCYKVNYRPKIHPASTKATITPSFQIPNGCDLTLTNNDNSDEYSYTGNQLASSSLALTWDPSTQSFMLDRVDSEFRFNLQSTPSNKDAASLAARYGHLDTGPSQHPDHDEDNLFDDNSTDPYPDDEPPDPNNPYDYRHFLNRGRTGRSPSPAPSSVSTPMPNHNLSSPMIHNSPHARPSRPLKVKAREHPRPRHLSPNSREEADADNEASDNDVLTIDMGEEVRNSQNKPWRHVFSALNEGGRGSGPTSLRSAASSMSPSLHGASDDGKEEDNIDGEESQSNADVEEIDLGDRGMDTPGDDARGEEVATPGNGWDDDSGDLEAEFEQALMSEAEQDRRNGDDNEDPMSVTNGAPPPMAIDESSEESEEE